MAPAGAPILRRMFRIFLALTLTAPVVVAAGATWERVGIGDCQGEPFAGSPGEEPYEDMCASTTLGRTARCFTQVCNPYCEYLDTPTPECRGGTEEAHLYTCRPAGGG